MVTQVFAGQLPDVSFPDLLTRLGEEARLGGSYFLCQQDDVMRIAKALEQVRAKRLRGLRCQHLCRRITDLFRDAQIPACLLMLSYEQLLPTAHQPLHPSRRINVLHSRFAPREVGRLAIAIAAYRQNVTVL